MHSESHETITEFDEVAGLGQPVQILHGLATLRSQIGRVRSLRGDGFEELWHRNPGGGFDFVHDHLHAVAQRDVRVKRLRAGGTNKKFASPAFENFEAATLEGPAELLGHGEGTRAGDIRRDADETQKVGLDGRRLDVAGHGGVAGFLDGPVGMVFPEVGLHFRAGLQDQTKRDISFRGEFRGVLGDFACFGLGGGFGFRLDGLDLRGGYRQFDSGRRFGDFGNGRPGYDIRFQGFRGFRAFLHSGLFLFVCLFGWTGGRVFQPDPLDGLALRFQPFFHHGGIVFNADAASVNIQGKVGESFSVQSGNGRLVTVVVGRSDQLTRVTTNSNRGEGPSRRIAFDFDGAVVFVEHARGEHMGNGFVAGAPNGTIGGHSPKRGFALFDGQADAVAATMAEQELGRLENAESVFGRAHMGGEGVHGLFIGFGRGADAFRQGWGALIARVAAFTPAVIPSSFGASTAETALVPIAALTRWSPALPPVAEIPTLPALATAALAAVVATASRAARATMPAIPAAFLGAGDRMVFPGRCGAFAKLVDPGRQDQQAGQIDRRRSGGVVAHDGNSLEVMGNGLTPEASRALAQEAIKTSGNLQPVLDKPTPDLLGCAPPAMNQSPARSLRRFFFWLSGAGTETLEACPNWEQRKYAAFGATVLVPSIFAFIACAYALSTLTENWRIILPVSVAWGFIILTIDRALLASYRPYQAFTRKFGQFALRFTVALLMGLTISHPLTLLLFKDTIQAEVEADRQAEIESARATGEKEKAKVRDAIATVETSITDLRDKWDKTFQAEFITGRDVDGKGDEAAAKSEAQKAMEAAAAEATASLRANLAKVDKELETAQTDARKLQGELDFWQREFEREVNGQRSGLVGLGPRARSVQDDQLLWRREETKRQALALENLTKERDRLRVEIAATESGVAADFEARSTELAQLAKAERDRVETLHRQVEQAQADQFVEQQNAIRSTLSKQIDTRLEEVNRLQGEMATVASASEHRIAGLRNEPRRDILTQTLALHELFNRGEDGGRFALTAYLVLTLLFMLVDTIPLIVKFFSKAGPYDTLLDREEMRFESERQAFLIAHRRYMAQLASGKLLTVTGDKPLERALITGIERSKAASEFLHSLMEMEKAFEERMISERGRATSHASVAALEDMAENFYADIRRRLEQFFQQGDPRAQIKS